MSYRRFLVGVAAGAVILTACSDSVGPPLEPLSSLPHLTTGSGVPLNVMRQREALETHEVTFWAVRGRPQMLVLYYQSLQTSPNLGDDDNSYFRSKPARFLQLYVPADALARHPDGRPIAMGDSVRITATVDPQYVIFRFAPHGLAFNPASPVVLEVWYSGANLDLDRDGDVDWYDNLLGSTKLGLWYEPVPGAGWQQSGAPHVWDNRYFTLLVTHFSGYAVSW